MLAELLALALTAAVLAPVVVGALLVFRRGGSTGGEAVTFAARRGPLAITVLATKPPSPRARPSSCATSMTSTAPCSLPPTSAANAVALKQPTATATQVNFNFIFVSR